MQVNTGSSDDAHGYRLCTYHDQAEQKITSYHLWVDRPF